MVSILSTFPPTVKIRNRVSAVDETEEGVDGTAECIGG
jgi:hypothetical protein